MTPNLQNLLDQYSTLEIPASIDFQEYNKILITSHSTRIEGSTLSFEEAFELIEKNRTPGGKKLTESLETIDHYNALNFVLEQAAKKAPLTAQLIREIASRVMQQTGNIYHNALGTVDASKGEFRNGSVHAGNATFMNHQKIAGAMGRLLDIINKELLNQTNIEAQLKLSFYAHYEVVNIHPFFDGNGRTSRLLGNFIQHYYKLPLSIVFAEDKTKYYQALDSMRASDDHSQFYKFMFLQYEKLLTMEISKVNDANKSENFRAFKP